MFAGAEEPVEPMRYGYFAQNSMHIADNDF